MTVAATNIFTDILKLRQIFRSDSSPPRRFPALETFYVWIGAEVLVGSSFCCDNFILRLSIEKRSTITQTYPHTILLHMIETCSWFFHLISNGSINVRAQELTYFLTYLKRNAVTVFSAVTKTLPGIQHTYSLNCMIFYADVIHENVVDEDQRCFHLVARWRDCSS